MNNQKSQEEEQQEEREKYRRIDNLADNNPWLQDSTTMSDIDRQSSKLAEHYIDNHLRGDPNGGQSSNTIKRELNAFYSVDSEKEPTLVRYTLRKMAGHPKTDSAITDFTKSDEYFISYKRTD
jgi:hypothetical protein